MKDSKYMVYSETSVNGGIVTHWLLKIHPRGYSQYTIVKKSNTNYTIKHRGKKISTYDTLESAMRMVELYQMRYQMGIKEPHAYIAGE